MKPLKLLSCVVILLLLSTSPVALGHWTPTMPAKWVQMPDPTPNGLDVDATNCILADDFPCKVTGPVTDIHIWGSWWHNQLPGDPRNVQFTLRIYSDDPAGLGGSDPQNGYSKPDQLLWQKVFPPGTFDVQTWPPGGPEGWYSPCRGVYEEVGDTICWQYNFIINKDEAFRQQGTPNRTVTYWLSVQAQMMIPTGAMFGWKTRQWPEHYQDDAVWANTTIPVFWNELRYPPGHPYYQMELNSIDLAFVINGEAEEQPEHDLGDAPDSSNNSPMVTMTAYPKGGGGGPPGVLAKYPTVYITGSPPFGPIHMQPLAIAYLGQAVSLENEADIGPDQDVTNNIIPPKDAPDLDGKDDGVTIPLVLPHCEWAKFDYWVTIAPFMPPVPDLYVNVWFDWNRDGDWDDTMECPRGDVIIPALEWAVRNQLIVGLPAGLHKITTPQFMPWHPPISPGSRPIWMRITISEQKWNPTSGIAGDGGSGPAQGYQYGETEDYYFVPEIPELDFGDAPESRTHLYPTTLSRNGARHIIVPGVCLGAQIDSEQDGQPTLLANGDDIANLADEDGVTYASAIIPGVTVDINIVASTSGALSAWLDYNGDGDWGEADEMVFAGQALVAGENRLQFNVPVTAVPGITTYARLRFTTADTALPYDGLAQNGEVEDYIVKIEEMPVKPPAEHLKWSQPPIERNPQSKTPVYCGWDEPSFKEEWEPPPIWKIVADDFRCIGSMPITSIHWWGSYKGYLYPQPPAVKPTAWRIGFWSNVPPSPVGGISHPGKLLWQLDIRADRVFEEWAGFDQLSDIILETCFQYYVDLTPSEYFWQQKFIDPQTKDDVFWLSIAAVYPPGPLPNNLWGWKTRPWHWMDDAVTFTIQGLHKPGYELDPSTVRPLEYCGQSYDAAFELDTDPNYIKWEQAFTGIRDWPHYEDEKSTAIEHQYTDKWLQPPDLTPPMPPNPPTGIGVDMFWVPLADDFKCNMTGPINCIRMWGCFAQDLLPKLGPGSLTLQVTIYADIPAKPSKPGNVLWQRVFKSGEYTVTELNPMPEGWYDPATNLYQPNDHQRIFQYDFHIPSTADPFTQQAGTIYWLEVKDLPFPPPDPDPRDYTFGWKTTLIQNRWNDDAVWNYWKVVPPQPPVVPGWNPLLYPPRHPYANTTLDLAFEIMTEKTELVIQHQVADDWRCKDKTPVTAIVWWGSYIDYRYEACQCQTTTPRPTKPDYFLLSIWTDVPVGPNNKFSHPGTTVWEYKAFDYDEILVGYDKHPETSPPGQPGSFEPVFRYSVKLPQTSWFRQKDVERVFWLSVVAVYKERLPEIVWGWTNHKHVFDPPDDAVVGYQGSTGGWIWEELYDQTGMSEDMSFVLFTEPGCFPSSYTTYDDWLALGKPNCWCGIYWAQDPDPLKKWRYQCDGDADGLTEGAAKLRVSLNDLNLIIGNWKKKITDLTLNPCADIDHKYEGAAKLRVSLNDLNIIIANWKKKDTGTGALPGNCPRP